MLKTVRGFFEFIQQQSLITLAVGFILGGAITKVVSSFVADIFTPILGVLLGVTSNLKDMYFLLGPNKVLWGDFLSNILDFLAIAAIVYVGLHKLGLSNLDKKDTPVVK